MEALTVGRIVRFMLPKGSRWAGEERAAMVAQVFSPDVANLVVFKGQPDDFDTTDPDGHRNVKPGATEWVGAAHCDPDGAPGTWHWPGCAEQTLASIPTVYVDGKQMAASRWEIASRAIQFAIGIEEAAGNNVADMELGIAFVHKVGTPPEEDVIAE